MREFISLVISGAVGGALYAIVASGLVLTYQTSGILNFAHGAAAFATALLFFELHSADGGMGLGIVPAAVISVVLFAPLLGWALDRVMLRKLATAPETARVVGTVGLLVAMPATAVFLVERLNALFDLGLPTNDQVYNPAGLGPRPKDVWSITRGVTVDSDQIAVFFAAAIAAAGLWFVLRHTRLGLETRAGVDRKPLAQLRGLDTDRLGAVSWMLSFFLAGLAGVLVAPLFDLEPLTYNLVVFAAFTAVVFAGLRSIPLAFAGGLLLGVVQNLVYGYAPDVLTEVSGFRSVLPFALLLVLLLVGTARARRGGAGALADSELPARDHRHGMPPLRRLLPWAGATAALALYVLFAADDFWSSLTAKGLALGLVFLSFVVVTGIGGMISLAQAAFVTTGAFTAGYLLDHQWSQTMPVLMHNGRMTFVVAVLAAAAVAGLVGVIVALPSLRLGGLTLALGTLALAFIGDRLVFQLESVRNGSSGWSVRPPGLAGIDFGEPRPMAMLLLVMCLVLTWGIGNLARSPSGRAMLAVRSTDVAARASGISPASTKLGLFAVSAAIAGLGGAMYATVASPFTNTTTPAIAGVVWLAVTVTLGVRRPAGAVIAGLLVAMSPSIIDWVTSSTFAWTVMFVVAVSFAVGFAAGVAGRGRVAGDRPGAVVAVLSGVALVVAAVVSSNAVLYAGLAGFGVLGGLPRGAVIATRPSLRAPFGVATFVAVLAAPHLVTLLASAQTAADTVHDLIGSTQFPMIMFGLGAIALATNPSGILAQAGEQLAAQRRPPPVPPAPRETVADPDARHARGSAARPATAPAPALRVEGLVAGWGEIDVVHGVDLDVDAGTMTTLLGANGAGKSTLCAALAGLVPARAGRILLDGEDVTAMPTFRRARTGLFLVPESRGLFPGLSVEDNLGIWLAGAGDRERAYERFPVLGARRRQQAGLLSGGEQQMLALASALERPPRVLIADEPTLGLAPLAVEDVFRALVELRDRGVALLLVEEKARDVLEVADHVVLMELGRIRWTGGRDEADADRLAGAYLGTRV